MDFYPSGLMGDGSARLGFGWVWIRLGLDSVVFWAPLSLGLGGIGLLALPDNFLS